MLEHPHVNCLFVKSGRVLPFGLRQELQAISVSYISLSLTYRLLNPVQKPFGSY